MNRAIDDLQARFGIDGAVRFETDAAGLVRAQVTTPAAEARVYRLGAHVTHFQPAGHEPVLFMSAASAYAVGQPLRGGVPVCFPWFGFRKDDPAAPNHGLVRQIEWDVAATSQAPDGDVTLSFRRADDAHTRKAWAHAFRLTYTVTVGRTLTLALRTENTGATACTCEQALHTYLAVGDVAEVRVRGLEGTGYADKTAKGARRVEAREPIRIRAETDRLYADTAATCVLEDPVLKRRITIRKTGSRTTVLWNPWIDKARAMPDFGDAEWPGMLCIETCAAADDAVHLNAGATHTMSAHIAVESSA